VIARLVIAWLGVVPLALLAALTVHVVAWKVLGYYVVPSLMLIAYIAWAMWWTGAYRWATASAPHRPSDRETPDA
jgi:hypothetical protein